MFLTEHAYSQSAKQEIINNGTIVKLHKAGFSDAILKSKIQNSKTNFDLSVDSLLNLKQEGISDEIINAMLDKSTADSSSQNSTTSDNSSKLTNNKKYQNLGSGIYYKSGDEYLELEPTVLSNTKAGGFGESVKRVASLGLAKSKAKATLGGSQAVTRINTYQPVFLFIFDTTEVSRGFSNDNNTGSAGVTSPNEFFLVKLDQNSNSREVVTGSANSVSNNIGIDDKVKVPFTYKKIQKGIYEVTPRQAFEHGEYCFMFAASSMYQGQAYKVYDFGF